MEIAKQVRPRRSLARRLIAPVAALALSAGAGLGAYHYYNLAQEDDGQKSASPVAAHSAPTAKDNLKLLFASDDEQSKKSSGVKNASPKILTASTKQDRYANTETKQVELPAAPLVKPLLTDDQPKTTSQDALVGDRYAGAATAVMTNPFENPASKQPAKQDVARGQDPHSNPLRVSGAPSNSPDFDARAAFGAALTQAPKAQTLPRKAKPPASNGSNDLAAALQQARPLQSTPPPNQLAPAKPALPLSRPPATLATNRYQQPPTKPAHPAARPTRQNPAPPLAIETSPQQQFPPQRSNPLATPPATLRNNTVSTTPPLPPQYEVAQSQPPKYDQPPQGLTPTPGLANHPGTGRPGETLLEGAQSPSITIQKLAPDEIQVGKRCTFAIRVQNSGRRTAQSVQIRDEVPLGTELVGTAPRATISGAEILWDLGTLSPGEERTVEMELLPKEEGELGSVATVSLSAQASAKSRCTRPELALRLSSKPQVHIGDQQVVQIELTNPGSGDATGVMLLETVPAGVSHAAGPALEFEVGTLHAGETRRMELVLTAEQAGKINNVMTARADASLQVEAACDFEVIAPELQLTVEGPQRRFLERPATYRVSIDNPGTAAAKEIQLVTHLPKGMQFVSANNMGEYDSSSHSVHWSLAELPANERGTVELVALPVESGAQTLQIATKAQQGLEDRTDKQVIVEGLSALTFEVTDVKSLIEVGEETTYEIRVQNQGSKAAANVQIAAIMPPGIRPLSGQGETRHAVQGERLVFAPLPQLAPKSETTFRIQAQGIRHGDQRVRVQITADDLQQPITKEVSTRVYADE